MKPGHLILLFVILCFALPAARAQDQRILRDKHAFETAADMYAVAETAAFDAVAATLIEKINLELKNKTLPEDDKIWNDFLKLEPYRMSKEVQRAVSDWISLMNFPGKSVRFEDDAIRSAYFEKDFDKVIERSRQALHVMPNSGMVTHVVRNNMALALMHRNKDLCAQVQLELVRKMSKEKGGAYFPALINLGVLYERLGKREEAEALAMELLRYTQKEQITVPLVNFNAAWYMDLKNQNNEKTGAIFKLSRGFDSSDVEKYRTFITKTRFDYQSRPFFEIGWSGKRGHFGSESGMARGTLLFLIVNVCIVAGLLCMMWLCAARKRLIWLSSIMGIVAIFSVIYWGLTGICLGYIIMNFFWFLVTLIIFKVIFKKDLV